MSRRTVWPVLVLLATLAPLQWLLPALMAQAPDKGAADNEDKQVVGSKPVRRTPAASVNFRKQLGLPFATLGTLGGRIDAARRAHDPVALASAANELAVAEKVAGKSADVTSRQVLQEAAELAKLRKQAAELKAVLQVSNQVMLEEDSIASLRKEVALAQAQAKADRDAFARNEEPTWGPRKVVVNNYTTQYLVVFVNGNYKGEVPPGMQQTFVIEHRWNPTVLTASGDEDIDTWGPRYIWGRFDKYTWNIN
jgi:hypothetical protein